ncbi:MAG: hypothetical protein ACM3SQ_01325 [Betaproteobacteria bacterium]
MVRVLRSAGLVFMLGVCAGVNAFAQAPPLVFTAPAPDPGSSQTVLQASATVEERGLALWDGTESDVGVGVGLSASRWTVRSIASITTLPVDGHGRPTFQQVEVVRRLFSTGSISVAGGGGIRQEWDGTRVLVGRVLAGSDLGRGRLQGSLVMEHTLSSPLIHDGADVVTSLGWSRRIGDRFSAGVEGIGQDLEGLWNPAEVDGGAKLLVGPSLHIQSKSGAWAASFTAGRVVHPASVASPPGLPRPADSSGGRHLGLFASATWVPSLHR